MSLWRSGSLFTDSDSLLLFPKPKDCRLLVYIICIFCFEFHASQSTVYPITPENGKVHHSPRMAFVKHSLSKLCLFQDHRGPYSSSGHLGYILVLFCHQLGVGAEFIQIARRIIFFYLRECRCRSSGSKLGNRAPCSRML